MKASCPNCKKVLRAPDEWAGKAVKCPECKQAVNLPCAGNESDDREFDFSSLEAIEKRGQPVIAEPRKSRKLMTLKEAQAAARQQVSKDPSAPSDPSLRMCPRCGQQVRIEDIYCDVICRHCGGTISGMEKTSAESVKYINLAAEKAPVSFYGGFSEATVYPLPALGYVAAGMGVALVAIALPLLAVLAFTATSSLNPTAEKVEFGWVGLFITAMFAAEAAYFGAIAYCILIDTIRTTSAGTDQPPSLTWNVAKLGPALGGYIILMAAYALIALLLIWIAGGGIPTQTKQFAILARPGNLIVLTLLAYVVPMCTIGLASSHALDGLNPIRVGLSIGRVIGHYTFLFLIVVLYVGVYVGVVSAVFTWAGPLIMEASGKGLGAGFVNMLMGLAGWAVLIGVGFYFAYSLGRILGLFSRSYRKRLEFEL